tara:strand:- start:3458 stop:4078 length:621 start_codon:yes stop_codon:yes gene_type:complete
MTDTSVYHSENAKKKRSFNSDVGPLVQESYWGYSVQNTTNVPLFFHVFQGVAFFVGAAFLAAIAGLWIIPSAAFQSDSMTLRLGLSVFFGALAWFMITYANRAVATEVQVDCNLCEVREVLKNRVGKSTLVGQFGFDSFSGITIDRSSGDKDHVRLVLNSHDPVQHVLVATGSEARVGVLYGRMTRDLIFQPDRRTFNAVEPAPAH